MQTVLVTGGTGHLGSEVVQLLAPTHRVRVLTRRPGTGGAGEQVRGDLVTGEGLADAVDGVDAVVHAATFSPAAQRGFLRPVDFRRSPPDVDVDGTSRLLDAAAQAGVDHFAYVSIVGVDRPALPYLQLKHTAEELVTISEVPWTILRATQFHWLVDRMLGAAGRLPLLPLPAALPVQPVDAADFAAFLVERLLEGPAGRVEDFGGPELLTLGQALQMWCRARENRPRVLKVPAPARMQRAAQRMTAPSGRRGTTTWQDWLAAHPAE
ncbi:NAD(P)H-binding protein [Saccharopolyspora sp. HNM0983]|uniref:NAD(P)H-binding protein n=1 Tax=Saccharopolyspora montiporae TaxID=2781240 RepID=A0A929BAH5_9PSEU|nr:NAD(P)H-binding protein [Saccharopolyspora sp. HNM0983]MBE9375241.1 NAD(P)H-binding protein [Saccharopolyspora sp. HNM0983]